MKIKNNVKFKFRIGDRLYLHHQGKNRQIWIQKLRKSNNKYYSSDFQFLLNPDGIQIGVQIVNT